MVFISIFMILLLIGVSLWLWRLSQAQIIHFAVLMTEPRLIVTSFSHLKELKEFAQAVPDEWLLLPEGESQMYLENPENIFTEPAPIIFPPQTDRYCGWVSLLNDIYF